MGWNMRIERDDKDVIKEKNEKQRIVNKANAKRKESERGDKLRWTIKWRRKKTDENMTSSSSRLQLNTMEMDSIS